MPEKRSEFTGPSDLELHITRIFDAPPALVFKACTEPDRMLRWWGPRGFTTLSCDVDLRVGGAWRVCSRSPEGVEHAEQGVFQEIVEPKRLVFTHAWEDTEGKPIHKTLVTMIFAPRNGKTKLTFHQTNFESLESRSGHEEGWNSSFDLLTEYLTQSEENNHGKAEMNADEAQIRNLIDEWAASLRTKNVDAVMMHYMPDVLSYDLAPPLSYSGVDVNRKNLEEWLRTFEGPVGYEVRNFSVTVGGDVAWSTGLEHISGRRTSGEQADVWVRSTIGYRRIDCRWRIAHEHKSVPFYMDGSDKAAVDLKP